MADVLGANRATGQDCISPLQRHCVTPLSGTEQCAADRGVRISVATLTNGFDHGISKIRAAQQEPAVQP